MKLTAKAAATKKTPEAKSGRDARREKQVARKARVGKKKRKAETSDDDDLCLQNKGKNCHSLAASAAADKEKGRFTLRKVLAAFENPRG